MVGLFGAPFKEWVVDERGKNVAPRACRLPLNHLHRSDRRVRKDACLTRRAERVAQDPRQAERHRLGDAEADTTVKAHGIVNVGDAPGLQVDQDVVEVAVTEAERRTDGRHDRRRPSVGVARVQPVLHRRRVAPQLVREDALRRRRAQVRQSRPEHRQRNVPTLARAQLGLHVAHIGLLACVLLKPRHEPLGKHLVRAETAPLPSGRCGSGMCGLARIRHLVHAVNGNGAVDPLDQAKLRLKRHHAVRHGAQLA